MRKGPTSYTAAEKAAFVAHSFEVGATKAAKKAKVNRQTIINWRIKYAPPPAPPRMVLANANGNGHAEGPQPPAPVGLERVEATLEQALADVRAMKAAWRQVLGA